MAKKYDIKTQKVGLTLDCTPEGQILNRVVRATPKGYQLEADPKHTELLIEQMGLEIAHGVVTPGGDAQDTCLIVGCDTDVHRAGGAALCVLAGVAPPPAAADAEPSSGRTPGACRTLASWKEGAATSDAADQYALVQQ